MPALQRPALARGAAAPAPATRRSRLEVLTPALTGAALGGAGLLSAGMTPLPGTVQAASLTLVGGSAAYAVTQARAARRAELLDQAAAALGSLIGRGEHVTMSARGWRGGWTGIPKRLSISYDPAAPSDAPDWISEIRTVLAARLQTEYKATRHNPRRCQLRLTALSPKLSIEGAPVPQLAERADDIISHLFGSDASTQTTWDGPNLCRLEVSHSAGVRISPNFILRSKIERTLNTMLPGRWRARWDLEADTAMFELRPEIPASLNRRLDPPDGEDLDRLPYAVDEDGNVLYWDLSSRAATPHFLIIGATGTGKSATIRGLVLEACRRQWRVRVCDPKRIEFVGVKGWPNVEIVATAVSDIVAVIHQTWLEMERRYQLIERGEATPEDFPRLMLVLDEYRYFHGIVNAWYAQVKGSGGARGCPILEEVFLIASLGRSARVNIILGTQRPDADWLGGDVRDQFMARASLGRLSPDGAKMMWGAHHIGVSVPRGKAGRGTSVNEAGEPVECQSYWTPDPSTTASADDLALLEALRPTTTTYDRHVVVPLPATGEDGQPIEEKGRYREYLNARYEPAIQHPDLVATSSIVPITPAQEVSSTYADLDANSTAIGVEEEREDTYLPPETVRANELDAGHLICVDEATDTWAVVETAETDLADSDQVCICWRSDEAGDDYGVLVIDADTTLAARSPRRTQ